MMRVLPFLVLILVASLAGARPAGADPVTVTIPRLERAPTLADFAEMTPAGLARAMARVEGFKARFPRDGEPMSERTEVYLGYDAEAIHAVFVCFDSEPGAIRSNLVARDRVPDSEDSIAFQLDTFRDRVHAYGFQANARGVQVDGLWTEGRGWDLSFDTTWHTDSRLTDQGYLVLISVPFSSLRFPRADRQEWGLMLFRSVARRNEQGFWPGFSTRIAGRMNQAAVLEGLADISPGRSMQIAPYVSSRSFEAIDAGAGGARRVSDAFDGAVGADAKWVIRDSMALDVTANPDFSHVESDEPQVTVNRRFETFFPEKRPFFLESASYFDTPVPLLFTRRIAQPRIGARVTGRVGPYAIGALAADDRPEARDAARVGVVRVSRDVATQSTAGVFLSSRDAGPESNRVAGVDTRLKLGANWFLAAQAVGTWTRHAGQDTRDGTAWRATVTRNGRALNYVADVNDRSAGFEVPLGFVDRVDIRSLDQTIGWRWRPAGSRLLSWGPDLAIAEVRDRGNRALDRSVTPRVSFEWPRQTRLSLFAEDARVRLRPGEVRGLREPLRVGQDRAGIEVATAVSRRWTVSARVLAGDDVNLRPAVGRTPGRAGLTQVQGDGEVRLSHQASLAATALVTTLRDRDTDRRIFANRIARLKLLYHFDRAWSVRAIGQFEQVVATPDLTTLGSRKGVNLDLLLTWLPSPGTAIYVGYNDNLSDVDPRLIVGPGGLLRTHGSLRSDARQLFVKASYLFRR